MLKEEDKRDSKSAETLAGLGTTLGTTLGLTTPLVSRAEMSLENERADVETVEMSAPSASQRVDKSFKASRQEEAVVGAFDPLKTRPLIKSRFLSLSQAPAPSRYQIMGKDKTS